MPLNDGQSRAPKQIGDFGEDLVTYTLIRKGYEVAKVDHVGADLIAEKQGARFAISVKTRMFAAESKESMGVLVSHGDIKKIEYFSQQFGLTPLTAHAYIVTKEDTIHLVIMSLGQVREVMKSVQGGYRKDIRDLIQDKRVDYSCWKEERIGMHNFVSSLGEIPKG